MGEGRGPRAEVLRNSLYRFSEYLYRLLACVFSRTLILPYVVLCHFHLFLFYVFSTFSPEVLNLVLLQDCRMCVGRERNCIFCGFLEIYFEIV